MKAPFKWDTYSDQPLQLKDKSFKKKMRKNESLSLLKTILTALIVLPISLVLMPFVKRKQINSNEFFSMGVDFQREPEKTIEFIEELNIDRILLRFKLWEMNSLNELKEFIQKLENKKIILKILQDRENIEDLGLLKNNLSTIFETLGYSVDIYEIGSTINRAKWGFFSVDEYSKFYQVAYDLKTTSFPNIKLIGSGVIDFEYHFTAHTLFNFYKYKYDGISSLLYVDRRGAPENIQFIFALTDKIAWLSTMIWLSPKTTQELHITETNWPISGTTPYAPTSEFECIDEESYADFMLRYYMLAFASQQVESVSWHQLIAPGYGLIDNRDGLCKRSAFKTYKFMIKNLKNAQFLRLDIKRDYYILQCLVNDQLLQIHWSTKSTTLKNEDFFEAYSRDGELIKDETLNIGSSPIYLYIIKEVSQKVNCL
ncbi:glycosyl hydrolase [Sulfurimonas aquatica]|uniref:Glycosyl hydrolase n=1 Tax=Sulfurimonas aquatica TaxID=2672570 RepID=A0A975AZ99_9BACT|nr:glycosyl hydrolase [Sulfurimonas aquatica]QSZ41322.1 glycosyl hydrolase [Sulfurimonas aquatica]